LIAAGKCMLIFVGGEVGSCGSCVALIIDDEKG